MDRGAWQAIVHGVAKSPRLMRRFWNPVSYHLVHSLAVFQNQADISPLSLSVLPLSFFVLVEFITPESLYCHGSKVLRRREVASSGKELTFLLFSIWSSFLAFLSSTLTSIRRRLISVLSFPLFLNLLRRGAGELAFSLVDMIMRQREKAARWGREKNFLVITLFGNNISIKGITKYTFNSYFHTRGGASFFSTMEKEFWPNYIWPLPSEGLRLPGAVLSTRNIMQTV